MNPLEKFAREVAEHLSGYTFGEMSNSMTAHLAGNDGRGLYLHSSDYDFNPEQSKVRITGRYPYHLGYGSLAHSQPEVGASAKRGPKAIAKDIEKRFLPKYLPAYQEALESLRRLVERDKEQERILAKLADILGVNVGQNRIYPDYPGYGYIQADGDFIEFHLRSIPKELAIELTKVISTCRKGA